MIRGLLSTLPILVFAALALAMWTAARAPEPAPVVRSALSGSEDAPLPADNRAAQGLRDWPLPSFDLPPMPGLEGGLSSRDLKGQVALVNVFASWCPPCRAEHPLLMDISKSTQVPIYGINWKDAKGAGTLFVRRHGNPFARIGADATGALGPALGVTAIPRTMVVDAQGRVRFVHVGRLTPDIWQNVLRPLIEKLESAT